MDALLDTGATISIVEEQFIDRYQTIKSKLIERSLSSVVGLGGNSLDIQGSVNCNLKIGSEIFDGDHLLHVVRTEQGVSIILGVDFIEKAGLVIDVTRRKVYKGTDVRNDLREWPMSMEMTGNTSNVYNINSETILPGERKIIPLTVKDKNVPNEGCIVPAECEYNKSWRLAGSINTFIADTTWGEIVNISKEPVTIKKGFRVGVYQPFCLILKIGDTKKDTEFIDELYKKLDLENLDISTSELSALKEVVREYKDVFSSGPYDLGYCDTVEHTIDIGDSQPVRQRYRCYHSPHKEEIEKELMKMKRQGVIEESTSPWCSPLVPVRKKDGRIRICVDYRKLNALTKFNSYPLPNIEDNLSQLSGARYFTTLDLLSGYHQVALEKSSREKTAFSDGQGLYQFRVMPQGACGSPATFQNLMNVVLKGVSSKRALAYLDDILVVGATFCEHLANIEEVLKRLRVHGLKLSVEKCNLFREEVLYLGHTLSNRGIKPARHNVEALLNLPVPTTVKQVRRLSGLVNYYAKFIPDVAEIMSPLYKITENRKLNWTESCQSAFDKVRNILSSYPVLAFPRYGPSDEFILTTDGSGIGIGAVLSQMQDGE